ncbi:7TM diverse intracellular signaling domain-containing protein [Xanthocytophaga agilis]|uniref:histidine kinase n=1 Tax=Xanthocytophaga agilis TaxID=3048010 RepID=A0AAE3R8A6_9BACT|nr:7TM diverse intracellular signaling domain-containing protein [Xanthocytophaga agilis]MDJ1502598.1 7TM diverse intracellular signaling domain-containing protein [Xanthocytophaga agilis]
MKKNFYGLWYLLIGIILFFAHDGYGQSQVFTYTDETTLQPLWDGLSILEDPSGKISAKEVLSYPDQKFTHTTGSVPNLGISHSTFWIKFQLTNHTERDHLVIKLAQPNIEDVTFYSILSEGKMSVEETGILYPIRNRLIKNQHFLFNVEIPKGKTGTFLLALKSNGQLEVPLWVGSTQAISDVSSKEDIYISLYVGLLLAMFFYNGFLFLAIRGRSYLLYILNIFVVGLTQATFQGYTYRFLWSDMPWISTHAIVILSALAGIIGTVFGSHFLRASKFTPNLNKGFIIPLAVYMLIIVLSAFDFLIESYILLQFNAFVAASYILFVAYRIYHKKSRTAGFFLLAWSIFLIGVCIFVLKDFGVIPFNNFTNNIMLIGSAVEMILLSFALADRINKLKKEKERSQKKMMEVLLTNEKLIQEENLRLEAKVRERTQELEESTEELQATLTNLRNTQAQLFQSEKMASLGQLTAGIAHEINNPINFVSASVKPLRRDVSYLWMLLDKYESSLKSMENELEKMEIEAMKKRLDVDYLREEIELLLKGVEEGASRTASIVLGLRNFSRLDDEDRRYVNIHEGLDATLLLLSHSLKENIHVQKDYTELPEIECYPGKLNQVFMNVLTNAVQAIKALNSVTKMGVLTIKTWKKDNMVCISIADNGVGMSESVMNKIFEPFFSTKGVGEGTGLGLSIAFGIIEAHKGTIEVKSTEGIGTEFIVCIPVTIAQELAIVA